ETRLEVVAEAATRVLVGVPDLRWHGPVGQHDPVDVAAPDDGLAAVVAHDDRRVDATQVRGRDGVVRDLPAASCSSATVAISPSPEARPDMTRWADHSGSARAMTRAMFARLVPFLALEVSPTSSTNRRAGCWAPSANACGPGPTAEP